MSSRKLKFKTVIATKTTAQNCEFFNSMDSRELLTVAGPEFYIVEMGDFVTFDNSLYFNFDQELKFQNNFNTCNGLIYMSSYRKLLNM